MRRTVALVALVSSLGVVAAARATLTAPTPSASAKARADAAQKAYVVAEAQLKAGTGTVEAVYLWSKRWSDAQHAPAKHLERMHDLETTVKARVTAGTLGAIETHAVAYYVAEAESP